MIAISNSESDTEITPVPSRKQSRVVTEESRPLSEDNDDHVINKIDSTSKDAALQPFNLGYLK